MDKLVISFQNVSKKYHLGLTRQSLPGSISRWVKRSFRPKAVDDNTSRILWALKDVSFTLSKGESLALVGSNGAGKTTILKLLSRITSPTSGKIQTRGKLSALIELGAGFHPDLTGRENVYLNGAVLGLKRKEIEARFDEIVSFAELDKFMDTPIKRYSSGMVVRLGFAIAACIKPDILLVDEVLAVGDISFQQKCLNRIHQLLQDGTSIIFVSHNFYLVKAVCNTALYLEKGEMKALGSTSEVIRAYEQSLHEKDQQTLEDQDLGLIESPRSDIEILQICVTDSDDQARQQFQSDKAVEIQIHYHAQKDFKAVQVSSHVYRADGLVCFQVRSFLDGVNFTIHKGKGVVKIKLNPILLTTGRYFATGAFLDENDSLVYARGRSDWFYVQGAGLTSDGNAGVYEPKAHWEHIQQSTLG